MVFVAKQYPSQRTIGPIHEYLRLQPLPISFQDCAAKGDIYPNYRPNQNGQARFVTSLRKIDSYEERFSH